MSTSFVIFYKKLKLINKDYLVKGGIIGVFLFFAYSLQTIGITDTTPGKNYTAVFSWIATFVFENMPQSFDGILLNPLDNSNKWV